MSNEPDPDPYAEERERLGALIRIDIARRLRDGPSPAQADDEAAMREAARVRELATAVKKRMTVLSIWCEHGQCPVGRVYRTKGRLLLILNNPQILRDPKHWPIANREKGHGWAKRHMDGQWLDVERPRVLGFTCACSNTNALHLVRSKVALAALDPDTRSVSAATLGRD